MSLVQLKSLTKRYGDHVAVNGVDLEIDRGQIFGLLGPNGAGKTTTISMLSGVLTPSAGSAWVDGHDIRAASMIARKSIGLVPQELALYEELTAVQNLRFLGSVYGLQGRSLSERIDWALELAGLRDRSTEPVHHFSGGMKRRLNLVAGLLHQPKFVVLDEPTVGVDPQSRNHIFETIRALRDEHNMTVLYTSHYMEEVQAMCRRVAIMDHGRIVANDTVENLLAEHEDGLLHVEIAGDVETARRVLDGIAEIHSVDKAEQGATLKIVCQGKYAEVVQMIEASGVEITSMRTVDANLEYLFLNLTGHLLRDS